MEDLEERVLEYESVGKFLAAIKKEFRGGKEELVLVKVVELKRLEQRERIMEEFMQEFKRAAKGSGYKGRPLIEEFKRGMNGMIKKKFMEAERPSMSIEQWYKCATNLDKY